MTFAARTGSLFLLLFTVGMTFGADSPPAPIPPAKGPTPALEVYRKSALTQDGDAARGRLLFLNEQRLACTKCHSFDGKGSKVGPDLFDVGDKFSRRDLIEAVLQPSATIAVGYATTVIATKSGGEIQGVLKQSAGNWIELANGDNVRTRIPVADIQEQRGSSLSLMPEGLESGLTVPEFTDLVEFLVTLKEQSHSLANKQGMPEDIPALSTPVALRPFLSQPLKVTPPASGWKDHVQTGLVWFAQAPGLPNVFLGIDQSGVIWRVEKRADGEVRSVFADLTSEVFSARGPNGLLGLAFHPKFRENRKYYLKHQIFEAGRIATVLVERTAAPDMSVDSGKPSRRLLKIDAVAEHHNGGCIQFGPDGFLYFGMGDSAPNHDPQGQSQDLRLLFGKMLRLDVDHRDPGLEYAVPKGNPYRGRTDARPEIWASGLREPWRFSFDPLNGDLWVGDLGQERGDEIDLVRRGENFGWNVFEGFEVFSHEHQRKGMTYVPPIFATRRKQGTTIVGGHVYRADPKSSFYGVYVFGDYTSKRIWGLTHRGRSLRSIRQLTVAPQSITAFSADEAGNLYAVGYEGMVYQLDFSGATFSASPKSAKR